jgi:hypothetical protein
MSWQANTGQRACDPPRHKGEHRGKLTQPLGRRISWPRWLTGRRPPPEPPTGAAAQVADQAANRSSGAGTAVPGAVSSTASETALWRTRLM